MTARPVHTLVVPMLISLGLLAAGCGDEDEAPPLGLGPGSRDLAVAAEDYRSLLAAGELGDLEAATVLTVAAADGGATVEDLLRQEQDCLDWAVVELLEIATPVTPTNGAVTFTDGTNTVTRPFGLADEQFGTVAPNSWYVVLDDPPCDGG